MKDRIQLSDHFTYGRLIRFTLPSIGMMIFTSIYGVVDGFFVSNFAGKTPFAAVNLAWPFLMILSTVGLMFGTGGSAIVAKSFGEGDRDRANPVLFPVRIRGGGGGRGAGGVGHCVCPACDSASGRPGCYAGKRCDLYPHHPAGPTVQRAADAVSGLLYHRRKASAGSFGHGGLGHHKHGAGCSAGDGPASGIQAGRAQRPPRL